MENVILSSEPIHQLNIENAIRAERQGDVVLILRKLENPVFGYDYVDGERNFVEFTHELEYHYLKGDVYEFSIHPEGKIDPNLPLFEQFVK